MSTYTTIAIAITAFGWWCVLRARSPPVLNMGLCIIAIGIFVLFVCIVILLSEKL